MTQLSKMQASEGLQVSKTLTEPKKHLVKQTAQPGLALESVPLPESEVSMVPVAGPSALLAPKQALLEALD